MAFRVSVGVLFVVCCLISGTSAFWWWLPDFDDAVPDDCPHSNNETHVCSYLVSAPSICRFSYCCGDDDWEDDEDMEEDCPDGVCVTIRLCTLYTCQYRCCDGYDGHWQTGCRNDTDEFECQNGGTRRTIYGYSYCDCLPGFKGRRCQNPICQCENMGECVARNNEPVCECPHGFTGTNCEHAICAEGCLNGGTCRSDGNDGFCICPEGFVGDHCEQEYINSEKCPSADTSNSDGDIRLDCTSNYDCSGEKVCCNEGSNMICRKPKPTVCNYKGKEYPVNAIFQPEPCMTCECLETGEHKCWSVACAMPQCENPTVHANHCCPTCPPEDCEIDGTIYKHNTTFKMDCNTCTCWDGDMMCTLIACGTTPEPVTCEHEGTIYLDGETFMDDCNECSCMSGRIACTEMECPEPLPCEHNDIIYANGVTFMDDCNECTCRSGLVACTEMACPPEQPCVVDDNRSYESGTTFKIACNTCQCYDGTYSCTKMNCECSLSCENDGNCTSEGEHETCKCKPPFRGHLCQIKYENPEQCPEPESEETEYTETCQTQCESNEDCNKDEVCCMEGCHMICRDVVCEVDGREFTPGDSYSPNPCKFCECSGDGTMMCAVVDCAMPVCPMGAEPVSSPDKCCPVCPEPPTECIHHNRTYQDGESFKDDCNTCSCHRGRVSCTEMGCPVRPELKCPTYVVELHAPSDSPSLRLTEAVTNVKAKADGRYLQVRFDPPNAHHCGCGNSDSMVYTAVAYTSYNGIRATCEFSYIVKDVTPPVFVTCPEDMYRLEYEEVTYKKPEYWDNVGIAREDCAMDRYKKTYPPGNYSFKYKVMDFDRNSASCSFMLFVSSSDTPVDQLPQGLKNRSSDGPHIAIIVAPVVGFLLVILMVVLFLWCCRFKRAQSNAGTPQHRPRGAFDNHIYAVPADVKAPDYNSLPPNPPAYHSDNKSIHSDYAFLPPPEYKEVEELRVPTAYVNPDYPTSRRVKDSIKSYYA